ncbi:MAG: sulfatase-like hydrolase/transferase [Planctomyces sp.]|jgi:arylsulfatase A-like enzyme
MTLRLQAGCCDLIDVVSFLILFATAVLAGADGAEVSRQAQTLPSATSESNRSSPPNIILIITDDQGYAPIERHGHPWLKTPGMNELHDTSTRFTRFLVCPTCSPTRAALMTGRHDMRNGVTHTILERERLTLQAEILPQMLARVGYTSGIFGKWHLGDEEQYQPHRRGFDESFIHGAGGIGQAYDCSCADVPGNSYFDPVVRHNGSFVKTKGFCTDVFFQAATTWISQMNESGRPFFAHIATNAPHSPYHAPDESRARFLKCGMTEDQAGFYGMIENIDQNIVRLLTFLKSRELLKNTVIIFMSDNGMAGGSLGTPGTVIGRQSDEVPMTVYNAGMKGLKASVDEGGVRVPFFVRWDGHLKPGQEVHQLAAHIDLLPTLAELTGAELPQNQVEGRSLLPLLHNPNAEWTDRMLFTHLGRWPVGSNPDEFQWKQFAVRNSRFRFVNDTFLFDMTNDPEQTTNVIADYPEVAKQMREAYDEWWKSTRSLMVNESAAMSPVRPYHELYERQVREKGIPLRVFPGF